MKHYNIVFGKTKPFKSDKELSDSEIENLWKKPVTIDKCKISMRNEHHGDAFNNIKFEDKKEIINALVEYLSKINENETLLTEAVYAHAIGDEQHTFYVMYKKDRMGYFIWSLENKTMYFRTQDYSKLDDLEEIIDYLS